MVMQTSYDIAIIGGGLAGLMQAALLAQNTPLSIVIIEEQVADNPWSASHYDMRVSAITLSSIHLLRQLKLWEPVLAHRVAPFTQIEVWTESHPTLLHFDCQEIAQAQLGFILENNLLQKVLLEKIHSSPQVTLLSDKLINLEINTETAVITAIKHPPITARLVIGADGTYSLVRKLMKIACKEKDYKEQAIVTHLTTELPHENTARQVFLTTGPLAFLPLASSHMSSIVWSLPTFEAESMLALTADDFKEQLNKRFSYRLGNILTLQKRYTFPLGTHHVKQYCQDRLALIGDAAHRVHPMAGLGINMGFADAARLTKTLIKSIQNNRDFARHYELRHYERASKAENATLLQGIDWLKTYFVQEKKLWSTTRNLGINVVNRSRFLKQFFMHYATGHTDRLPTTSL
jgi:2-polyprenylphenol 6-hydroxylase